MIGRRWVLAVTLLGTTAIGSPALAETLEEAMAAAYNNNPTLLARRSALRATDESVAQAISGWRPTVQFNGEVGKSFIASSVESSSGTRESDQTVTPRSAAVSVSQPLYTGGRVSAAVESAEDSVLAGRADLANTEQAVLLEVATSYLNVLRDGAVLELNTKNVQVLRRQLEAAQDRFRVGEITKTDVAQAEARLSRAIADRVRAAGTLEATRAAYQNAVGHLPEQLQPPKPVLNLPVSSGEVVALAADENPAVIAAAWAARAAEAGVDQIVGELYPRASLNATFAKSIDQSTRGVESDVAEATLAVTVPLYESGSVYSRVRGQKHTANQRRIQVYEARRNAVEAAKAAWETWQAAKARIESLSAQIRAAEIALEGVQREAQVGSRTVLDVLDAEQELLDSRVNLVVAQRDEKVAAFQILQATGRLTGPALGLAVDYYDPKQHYDRVRGKWIGTDVELVPEKQ